jgi:hypothetical protein
MLLCSAVFLTACGGAEEAALDAALSAGDEQTIAGGQPLEQESDVIEASGSTSPSITPTTSETSDKLVLRTTDGSTEVSTLESEVTSISLGETSAAEQIAGQDDSLDLSDFTLLTESSTVEDVVTVSAGGSPTASSTTTTDSTSSVVDTPQVTVIPTVTANIQWSAPEQRENGDTLYLYEIAGYEVQYRKVGATDFTVVRVEEDGSGAQEINIEVTSDSDYELLIASYDLDGLYSDYYEARIDGLADLVANGG